MPKLSIVIPVYFNELNLPSLYQNLHDNVLTNNQAEYEIIFVDDGSGDNSYHELRKIAAVDNRVKILKLSRNFGSHVAILAGLNYITGDCATVISADLQDPPEIITRMFEKWLEGNKVVLAVRADREEPWLQKTISNTFYRLMKQFALKNMPLGGFDCFLIDRCVVENITGMNEKNSTLMGQILWCGYKTDAIKYFRKKREVGKSRWTLSKKIKYFIDSFLAFSFTPIKTISTLGILFSLLGFCWAIIIIVNKFLNNIPVEGYTSLTVIVLILSGVQLITLGVIGEYLWRNFDESRKRPTFIIEETVGVDK